MIKKINLTTEMLIRNTTASAQEVKSWPSWKRNVFGGVYTKVIVNGKVVLSQEKVQSSVKDNESR